VMTDVFLLFGLVLCGLVVWTGSGVWNINDDRDMISLNTYALEFVINHK